MNTFNPDTLLRAEDVMNALKSKDGMRSLIRFINEQSDFQSHYDHKIKSYLDLEKEVTKLDHTLISVYEVEKSTFEHVVSVATRIRKEACLSRNVGAITHDECVSISTRVGNMICAVRQPRILEPTPHWAYHG